MTKLQRQTIHALATHVGYDLETEEFEPGVPTQFSEEGVRLLLDLLLILFASMEEN